MEKILTLVIDDKKPTELPIEDLGTLLHLLGKALKAANPSASSEYNLKYSLVSLESGSTVLAYSSNNSYIGALQAKELTRQMADPEKRRSVKSYRNFQDKCNELNTAILFFPGRDEKPALRLVPEKPPKQATFTGQTTIFGVLERIGGASVVSAHVRQHGMEKIINVTLTRDMATQMAQYLYKDVRIDGEAVWDAESLEIVTFTARGFETFNPIPIKDTLIKLAQLTGLGIWHNTGQTIEEALLDLRGGGED